MATFITYFIDKILSHSLQKMFFHFASLFSLHEDFLMDFTHIFLYRKYVPHFCQSQFSEKLHSPPRFFFLSLKIFIHNKYTLNANLWPSAEQNLRNYTHT